jgi:hypothetical protein
VFGQRVLATVAVVVVLAACAPPPAPTPLAAPRAVPPTATTVVRVVYVNGAPTPTSPLVAPSSPSPFAPPSPPPAPVTPRPAGAAPARVPPGDGIVLVGVDVAPGVYRSAPQTRTEGVVRTCFWARLSGTTGSSSDTITSDLSDGPSVVTIAPTDVAFKTQFCGSWTRVG